MTCAARLAALLCFWSPLARAEQDNSVAVECRPRAGLPNFFAKLKAGLEVRIGYIGGSITAQDGWRPKTLHWFQERYPKAKISEINAAIGGTGSDLGVFRHRRDVLDKKPDLVFVEFAVNDSAAEPSRIRRSMEGIVRQTIRQDPAIDICFVYTVGGKQRMLEPLKTGKQWASCIEMDTLADQYGIPSIQMGLEVARLEAAGKLVFAGPQPKTDAEKAALAGKILFSPDEYHPYDDGHKLYLESIVRAMKQIEPLAKPGPHPLPSPLAADNWEAAKLVPLTSAEMSGEWKKLDMNSEPAKHFRNRMPILWKADLAGASISFSFKGPWVGMYDLTGPDCGQVSVTLDDKPAVLKPRFTMWSTYHNGQALPIGEGLPDGVHRVKLQLTADKLDKAKILAQRGERMDDPKRFDGLSWYVGDIMVIGDVVKR